MTRKTMGWLLVAALVVLGAADGARAEGHRIGAGATYWVSLDNIDVDDVDEEGLSYMITYQYRPGLLGLELDAEWMPDRFGEDAFAPQAYVLLGKALYAGAGIGIGYVDGDFQDEPFFAFKAGLDLEILPSLFLDLSANYRFNDSTDLDNEETDIDTDTIFLGAAVRMSL